MARAQDHDLPSKITGHRPLEVQIKVLQVSPASREDMDHEEQPPIRPPDEHDTHRWIAYYRTVQRILGQQDETDLNLAMRQAATACSLYRQHRTQDDASPDQELRSLVTAIWRDKQALHTAVHSHDPQAQHDAQNIAARLDTTRRQLREWHVRRAKELAQEQQRYFSNLQPYKSLKDVDKVLGEKGHRGIKAVRLQDGTVTNDPKWSWRKSSTASSANTTPRIMSYQRTWRNSYHTCRNSTTKRSDETCTEPRSPFGNSMKCCTNYNREKPRGWTDSRRNSTAGFR